MLSDEYYRLLGLERSASSEDIKKIYRKLAKRLHPDSLGAEPSPEEIRSAEEHFKRMSEAYEAILSYALKRENSGGNNERESRERENKEREKQEERIRQEAERKKQEEKIILDAQKREWRLKSQSIWINSKQFLNIRTGNIETEIKNNVEIRENFIGMKFLLIPSGEFDMGSPSNDLDTIFEGPVHHVKIPRPFYMGRCQVTQKQFRDIMGTSPSNFKGDNLPVEQVSWNDIQDFIKKLNEKEGGNKYRLPSEAEWEYAARAGTKTSYSFGDDESKLGDYAWYYANSGRKTHDVGQKEPNPWGLYDMHGNVWEWVQDKFHSDYNGAPTDGSSWESGYESLRVVRGGDWYDSAGRCQSASRIYDILFCGDYTPNRGIGFRLLRIL